MESPTACMSSLNPPSPMIMIISKTSDELQSYPSHPAISASGGLFVPDSIPKPFENFCIAVLLSQLYLKNWLHDSTGSQYEVKKV